MAPDPQLLATAIEAVVRAGDLQMARLGTAVHVSKKGAIDLVTDVDVAVERMVRALIAERFPDHHVLAEEFAARPRPCDDSREELVEGRVQVTPPPGAEHGDVTIVIGSALHAFVRKHKLGRVLAEAAGPWVRVEVCSWQGHKPVASRVFNAEDLRACDFYHDRKTWLVAVSDVDRANASKLPG